MIGYGVIRCFVEGLRTDSLYLMPGVRVSQVLSGCLILLGVLLVGIIRRRKDIQA
ncbi:prolipoprotein diacylglyceryl transferase family protein [Agathobacter rectalis]|uniref:prolipoprotein diacylglyceryl transferase family protein n=1 Tax=Agathobacter rectalis TaxID=39491 RepID=UPI003A84081D